MTVPQSINGSPLAPLGWTGKTTMSQHSALYDWKQILAVRFQNIVENLLRGVEAINSSWLTVNGFWNKTFNNHIWYNFLLSILYCSTFLLLWCFQCWISQQHWVQRLWYRTYLSPPCGFFTCLAHVKFVLLQQWWVKKNNSGFTIGIALILKKAIHIYRYWHINIKLVLGPLLCTVFL